MKGLVVVFPLPFFLTRQKMRRTGFRETGLSPMTRSNDSWTTPTQHLRTSIGALTWTARLRLRYHLVNNRDETRAVVALG